MGMVAGELVDPDISEALNGRAGELAGAAAGLPKV